MEEHRKVIITIIIIIKHIIKCKRGNVKYPQMNGVVEELLKAVKSL